MTSEVKLKILIATLVLAVLAGISCGTYLYLQNTDLNERITELESNLTSTNNALDQEIIINNDLSQALDIEQEKNKIAETQIESLSGTVGNFEKLSKIDPELLGKYSKVYFLSENYVPIQLVKIEQPYLYDIKKEQQILHGVAPFIQVMLAAAERGGAHIKVLSAYRSFGEQTQLKSSYKFVYGTGANQFSAEQGYSEHQLGTAIDLAVSGSSGLTVDFQNSTEYKWLTDNAYKYGFVLSYPKGNSYYQFEPWHWRFIGRTLATKLYNENKYFYDLDQREIDQYLISIFD